MKRSILFVITLLTILLLEKDCVVAQSYTIGARSGLSLASANGSSTSGFQLGPTFDMSFGKGRLGSDFTINTQNGNPVIWANYFKYLFYLSGSKIIPYADGGFSLWFVTGGPYFGLQFGGGAYFPLTKDISIPADIQIGPVFTTGSTTFYLAMTSGIRYTLP